jgi:Spy/CpxP family protein refolding chaperone
VRPQTPDLEPGVHARHTNFPQAFPNNPIHSDQEKTTMLRKISLRLPLAALLAATVACTPAFAQDKMSGMKMSSSKMSGGKMSGGKMSGSMMMSGMTAAQKRTYSRMTKSEKAGRHEDDERHQDVGHDRDAEAHLLADVADGEEGRDDEDERQDDGRLENVGRQDVRRDVEPSST